MADPSASPSTRWARLSGAPGQLLRTYAHWLVGISWKRFFALSAMLLVLANILKDVPPFRWSIESDRAAAMEPPPEPKLRPDTPPRPSGGEQGEKERSVLGNPGAAPTEAVPPGAAASDVPRAPSSPAVAPSSGGDGQALESPRELARQARRQVTEALREANDARRLARQAVEDARGELADARYAARPRTRTLRFGEALPDLALLLILGSAILKAAYQGTLQAQVQAAAATETAESEQLKRQVVEARMAAMQAQVEPHFLFNTLASIDHLIETDPKRASLMQKNLIALLRASMPTMRETRPAAQSLGREMAVVRPYLEILKVRMEERLRTAIEVPEGLLSADFPPMMIQSLVENAIRHGLEPKPEGGLLRVSAQIAHGKLVIVVADTGVGFGKSPTGGSGVGLKNIRERLALLYGDNATMVVAENLLSGTHVTLELPYQVQRQGSSSQGPGPQRARYD